MGPNLKKVREGGAIDGMTWKVGAERVNGKGTISVCERNLKSEI